MFEKFSAAPADPILGLASLFIRDQRSNKINLGIGVYKDKRGETPILNCVKKAEQYLLNNERSKNYLGIAGAPQFSQVTQALIFGDNSPLIKANRVRTAHTPGGTGALRVCADVLARTHEVKRIWVSDPSWPNHHSIFKAAGLEVCQYPYYDTQTHTFDFEAMLACLENVAATDAVLFHGCCHNPTGIDPTCEQWQKLAELALNKGWLPVFDLAYQGFGLGLDEDALGLRIFAETVPEMLVASSYSKNFGLYNERVGAFNLIAADSDIADRAFSQTLAIIRANYSTPPTHGGAIVSTILSDQALKDEWLEELTNMRHRIYRMRQLFVKTLKEKGADKDFSFISQQKGMFSFSGLSAEQVLKLRNDYGIYIVGSGRINVAGMTLDNMPLLCESIVNVL